MTLEDRIAMLETKVFGQPWEPEPLKPHKWVAVYRFGSYYPDGRRCSVCGKSDINETLKECQP